MRLLLPFASLFALNVIAAAAPTMSQSVVAPCFVDRMPIDRPDLSRVEHMPVMRPDTVKLDKMPVDRMRCAPENRLAPQDTNLDQFHVLPNNR